MGREGVVRERLYTLLDTLGALPTAEKACPWGVSFARALGSACPAGYTVMNTYHPAGSAVVVDHLLVGPAGLVVVGPGQEGAHGRGRPAAVRDTLRQAFALRAWLKQTSWADVTVLSAVCWPPAPGPGEHTSVCMDGLWAGPIDQLAPFLISLAHAPGPAQASKPGTGPTAGAAVAAGDVPNLVGFLAGFGAGPGLEGLPGSSATAGRSGPLP